MERPWKVWFSPPCRAENPADRTTTLRRCLVDTQEAGTRSFRVTAGGLTGAGSASHWDLRQRLRRIPYIDTEKRNAWIYRNECNEEREEGGGRTGKSVLRHGDVWVCI